MALEMPKDYYVLHSSKNANGSWEIRLISLADILPHIPDDVFQQAVDKVVENPNRRPETMVVGEDYLQAEQEAVSLSKKLGALYAYRPTGGVPARAYIDDQRSQFRDLWHNNHKEFIKRFAEYAGQWVWIEDARVRESSVSQSYVRTAAANEQGSKGYLVLLLSELKAIMEGREPVASIIHHSEQSLPLSL